MVLKQRCHTSGGGRGDHAGPMFGELGVGTVLSGDLRREKQAVCRMGRGVRWGVASGGWIGVRIEMRRGV
jgi:hypothetical protein